MRSIRVPRSLKRGRPAIGEAPRCRWQSTSGAVGDTRPAGQALTSRQITLPGANEHGPSEPKVADGDNTACDGRQRSVAAILNPPDRTADGGGRVEAPCLEVALAVAPEVPDWRRRPGLASGGISAGEEELREVLSLRLTNDKRSAVEVRRSVRAGETHSTGARINDRIDRNPDLGRQPRSPRLPRLAVV